MAEPLRRRPRVAAAATFVAGLALAGAAAHRQALDNAVLAASRFDALAARVSSQLSLRLKLYEHALRGTRGAVLAVGPEQISRDRFRVYSQSRDLAREFPGVRGVGVIRRVAAEQEAAFVAAARRDGAPDFAVRLLAPHAGARYVIQYIEPQPPNREAVGLDVASEAHRRDAAESSARSGGAALTGPITLVQATGLPLRSFLLMLPIYRSGAPLDTPEARLAATFGWSYAALVIDDVLEGFDFGAGDFALALHDASATPFYASPGSDAPAAAGLQSRMDLPLYGRTWRAEIRARPPFVAALNLRNPATVGLGGAALAALLAVLVYLHTQGARRAAMAHAEQARRAAIADASGEAIIGQGLDGRVTDWNPAAERLFGHPAQAAIGQPLAGLLLPPERQAEDAQVRAAVSAQQPVARFDTTRRHQDGRLIDVALAVAPLAGPDGRLAGWSSTLRDVTQAQEAQRRILELNLTLEQQVQERTALLESAQRHLRGILDAIPSVVGYWDRMLRNRFANHAYGPWFGVDPARMPGMHIREMLGPVYALNLPHMEAALRGEPQLFERLLPLPGGGDWHGLTHYVPDVVDGEVRGFYAIVHDITAAKRAEQKLRASEAFLDRAGRVAGVGGWELDLRTQAITWSTQTRRIHEVDDAYEPKLESAIAFYAPSARATVEQAVAQGMQTGAGWDLELPFITARGRHIWVRTVGQVEHEDGQAVRLVGAFQDVTARKHAEEQLQQAHDRFSIAADAAGIGVWEWDVPTASLVWDERMYRLYRRERSAAAEPYALWSTSLHPDDRAPSEAALAAALRGEHDFDPEFRIVWPDGEVRHLKADARVIRGAAGAPLRVTGVNIDVTERKRAEQELRTTGSMLRSVLDSASEVSIIATTPDLTIRVFNRGAERLLGHAAADVVGRATPLLIHDPDEVEARSRELGAVLGRTLGVGEVFMEPSVLRRAREWIYVAKDGRRISVSLVVTAMHGDDGELLGYLSMAHDVTRQKQHEAALHEARQKAEQASQAKSEFLANMSHEIRTPLNAVIGLSYLLGQTELSGDQADLLGKIQVAGKSLLALINDVLDLSKIEAGELMVERVPFSLPVLLAELKGGMAPQAEARQIRFAIDAPAGLPALLGDVMRLNQILGNLLSNAIKFTERGGVSLRVERLAQTSPMAGTVRLRFVVQDTGIGIAPEVQPRLFVPFAQADASTTRRFGGTGLGLSIVRRLVQLAGGQVGLSSTLGVGSEFWVLLDFATAPLEALVPPPRQARPGDRVLAGLQVLVVDDSRLNLDVVRRVLELAGAWVAVAGNGQEAVEQLRALPRAFDLVLMDVQMPVLDGCAATQCIRGELGLADLPVIALTAGALTSERLRATQAGMNDFISKPFEAAALVEAIRRHAQRRGPGVMVQAEAEAPAPDTGPWPEIDGIDAQDVRARLGSDVELFQVSLRRMLDEFADVSMPGGVLDRDVLAQHAGRMHKLMGSAGLLGARQIHDLARRAEAACREGEARSAGQLAERLVAQLQRLRDSAAPVLERALAEAQDPATACAGDIEPRDLQALIDLLRRHSLSATDQFRTLAPALRRRLGDTAFLQLQAHVESLRFRDAAALLEAPVGP